MLSQRTVYVIFVVTLNKISLWNSVVVTGSVTVVAVVELYN